MKLPFAVTDKSSINNSVSLTVDWTECLSSFVNSIETFFFSPTATFCSGYKCHCLSSARGIRWGRENLMASGVRSGIQMHGVFFRGQLKGSVGRIFKWWILSGPWTLHSPSRRGRAWLQKSSPSLSYFMCPLIPQLLREGGAGNVGGWVGEMVREGERANLNSEGHTSSFLSPAFFSVKLMCVANILSMGPGSLSNCL